MSPEQRCVVVRSTGTAARLFRRERKMGRASCDARTPERFARKARCWYPAPNVSSLGLIETVEETVAGCDVGKVDDHSDTQSKGRT